MSGYSRRDLAKITAGAIGAAGAVKGAAPEKAAPESRNPYRFPKDFVWGTATASYQVEGAAAEDGRKPSTWDKYSHTPGRTHEGATGDIADDHYHRYKEDVQLMKRLGVKAYRFSIAWPRVFPDGYGQPNEKGIAFYDRLVDELNANGIEPWATLFHWDLPQALEDSIGGWRSRDTARHFADYAAFVAKRLSDRVGHFYTINEFSCFTDEGYGSGTKAPGHKLGQKVLCQVRHHAVYAHGLAAQALRASARRSILVGIAENPTVTVPVIECAEHIPAARKAMRELNAPFLTTVLEGKYPDSYLTKMGADAPKHTGDEMKTIGTKLDFVGLNCYAPTYIRKADTPEGFAIVPHPSSYPHMSSPWLYIGPQILYWAPRHLAEIWGVKAIYITENGCSAADDVLVEGRVYDTDRVMYLRNHLIQAQRATAEGWPLKGYFLWSLMDNFEWNDGYTNRFGIHHVDFASQKRTPKLSAEFYHDVIARGVVV